MSVIIKEGENWVAQFLNRVFGGRETNAVTISGVDGSATFHKEAVFEDAVEFESSVEFSNAATTGIVRKASLAIGHADLTDADGSQTLTIATLPAGAQVLGVNVKLATPFTGGGAGSVTLDVGSSGDADALVDGANVFAAAVDGQASTRPLGIAPNKQFAAATAVQATVAADVNVADLTAGAMTVEVIYSVLA